MNMIKTTLIALTMMIGSTAAMSETVGSIKLAGGYVTSYALKIQAFDDPRVQGVSCHVSDVEVSGITFNSDPSNASISCRQTGQIKIHGATKEQWWGDLNAAPNGESVFGKTKGWNKSLSVVRVIDKKRKTMVYVVYTPKWGEDSKKNVVSSISMYAQTKK